MTGAGFYRIIPAYGTVCFRRQNKSEEASQAQDMPMEEDFFSKKIISMIVGLIVVVLVISGGTYYFLKSRTGKNQTKQPSMLGRITQTPKVKDQEAQPSNGTQNKTMGKGAKLYTDSFYKYSILIPQDMETFKRVGDAVSYQIGIRKIGQTDAPITISTQPNQTGENLDQWVTSEYGSISRQAKKVGGADALFIRNDQSQIISYVFMRNSSVYEFVASTIDNSYIDIFNQIISSFTFVSK